MKLEVVTQDTIRNSENPYLAHQEYLLWLEKQRKIDAKTFDEHFKPELTRLEKLYQSRTPEAKARAKEYHKRPEVVAKRKEYNKSPEAKAKKREYYHRKRKNII